MNDKIYCGNLFIYYLSSSEIMPNVMRADNDMVLHAIFSHKHSRQRRTMRIRLIELVGSLDKRDKAALALRYSGVPN